MNTKEIQKRVDALADAMTAKGLSQAGAKIQVNSHEKEFLVILKWVDVSKPDHSLDRTGYEFIRASTPEEALANADEFISKLPTADETRINQFMGALASVIDLGNQNGVDVEFINPLKVTMKKLSENVITDKREVGKYSVSGE